MNLKYQRRSFMYTTTLSKIMNNCRKVYPFPILIMYGEQDHPLAISLSKEWHSYTEGSRLVGIADAKHCANMDQVDSFNQVILDFISNRK